MLAACCLLFVLHAALYWPWLEDDAFITLRYAENLVAGEGLVFNPGQRVEGYSNLAWVLLAAAAKRAGADPLVMVRLAGITSGVICLLLAWALAGRLRPGGGRALLLAPLFLAASPILARHAVSGLETNAYAACLTFGLWWLAGGSRSPRAAVLAVLPLILLFLLRPEGALFGLLILILDRRGAAGRSLIWIVFCLALSVFLCWRWLYFGSLLPNTFYFKMTGGDAALRPGFFHVREFLHDSGGAVLVGFGLALFLSEGAAPLLRRFGVVIAAQLGVILAAGGDWMQHYRFFAPLLPLLAAGLAAGVGQVLATCRQASGRRHLPALVVGAALATAYSGVYLGERAVWHAVMPAVRSGQYLSQAYARVGIWLREQTPPGSVVAVSDVGAVGYYSGREVVDMFGLVDHHIARTPGILHGKQDPDYILARRPDYVVLVERKDRDCRPWYWRLADQALAARPEFQDGYVLQHSIAMGFEDETARIYRRRAEP